MKMAAIQLMQQKANKDVKSDTPAITDASESNADTTQTQTEASEGLTESASQTDSPSSQAETDKEDKPSESTSNGPLDLTATQNGECKNPLAGKELEESIPGLAQAKELAETLVAEDGSCIGTSKNTPKHMARTMQGLLLWWIWVK